jgi:hypothetical protein
VQPDRGDEPAARCELVPPGWGDVDRFGGDDDPLVRCPGRLAEGAVAADDGDGQAGAVATIWAYGEWRVQLVPDCGAAGNTSYEVRCGEDRFSCCALFIIGALLLIAFVVLAVVLAVRVWKTGK